jgi:hypothetical protein
MSLTDIGIVGIDIVFAAALVLAASCLAYLVYLTVREHAELKSMAHGPASVATNVCETTSSTAVRGLRPSTVRRRVTPSS